MLKNAKGIDVSYHQGKIDWEKVYFCEYNPVAGSQTQTLTVVQIIGIC